MLIFGVHQGHRAEVCSDGLSALPRSLQICVRNVTFVGRAWNAFFEKKGQRGFAALCGPYICYDGLRPCAPGQNAHTHRSPSCARETACCSAPPHTGGAALSRDTQAPSPDRTAWTATLNP